jgi:CubicO group peptidase (beta-lactamase class C family)
MTMRLTRLFGPMVGPLMAPAVLLAATLPAAGETPSEKADLLLRGVVGTNDPGVAVLVAQDGKILFEKCYGLADVEHHVPITLQTTFRIASVTKQFTAAAILKLQEERKLSVKDKLSKYIPDFPRGNEVTLRELLNHTSGIRDYLREPNDPSRATNVITEAVLDEIKTFPYDFDPGTKWSYSNSGYLLLGYIVAKVSGQSYGDFLRENFSQPLGMTNTGIYHTNLDLPHQALGYSFGTNGFERAYWPGVDNEPLWVGGDGALYSTVGDLYRWNEGIFNGRVLDTASLKAAFTPVNKKVSQLLDSGDGYGFGWFVSRDRGLRQISHAGGIPGFDSVLLRLPDEKFTVAILENALTCKPAASPPFLAYQIMDIYLADKVAPPATVDTNVSPESYDALTGRYDLMGGILTISKRGTHLFAHMPDDTEGEILPKSGTEFFWKGGEDFIPFTFMKDGSGKAAEVIFDWCGVMDLACPRTYDNLAGKYDYGQYGVLAVTCEGSHVFAQLADQPKCEIFPKSETNFYWKVVHAQITFVTDTTGKVTRAIHDQNGQTIDAPKIQ